MFFFDDRLGGPPFVLSASEVNDRLTGHLRPPQHASPLVVAQTTEAHVTTAHGARDVMRGEAVEDPALHGFSGFPARPSAKAIAAS